MRASFLLLTHNYSLNGWVLRNSSSANGFRRLRLTYLQNCSLTRIDKKDSISIEEKIEKLNTLNVQNSIHEYMEFSKRRQLLNLLVCGEIKKIVG